MGIAAYNRGSKAVREHIYRHALSQTERFLRDLNQEVTGTVRPFCGSVIRFDGERWWVMNKKEQGWASSGVPLLSLHDVVRKYAIVLGNFSHDKHSPFIEFEPLR